jgi:hypothetical protein
MEESGHYYTVYFTSLAVGFAEDVAYQQAVMAQMPDEVGWLDAANLHTDECLGFKEYDLNSNKVKVPNEWRYLVEYALHSLPDKRTANTSSDYQRGVTRKLLLQESPVSLKFGMLLHRLGDTYAHSIMGNEKKMYTVAENTDVCSSLDSLGHARDSHNPDYPFLRPGLFYLYLDDLYNILLKKVNSPESQLYRRRMLSVLSADNIKKIFHDILEDPNGMVMFSLMNNMVYGSSYTMTQQMLIDQIRKAAVKYLKVEMKPYAPEKSGGLTLREFLSQHEELRQMGINSDSITNSLNSIYKGVTTGN